MPREHPAYGKQYGEVDLRCHGGVTYAAACEGDICHVPAPGMPDDVWWFGCDFGHCRDLSPGIRARLREYLAESSYSVREVYRPLPYARAQTESLAEQLRALAT